MLILVNSETAPEEVVDEDSDRVPEANGCEADESESNESDAVAAPAIRRIRSRMVLSSDDEDSEDSDVDGVNPKDGMGFVGESNKDKNADGQQVSMRMHDIRS